MNENTYIEALLAALSTLPQPEREAVAEDYRQHFREGRAQGRTDAEIIDTLGDPQLAAGAYMDDCFFDRADEQPGRPAATRSGSWKVLAIVLAVVTVVIAGAATGGYFWLRHLAATAEPDSTIAGGPSAGIEIDQDGRVNLYSPWGSLTVDEDGRVELQGELGASDATHWGQGLMGIGKIIDESDLKTLDYQGEHTADRIEVNGNWQLGCRVVAGQGDTIGVTLSGRIPQDHDVTVESAGGKLVIRYQDHNVSVSMGEDYQPLVTLTMPQGWQGDLNAQTLSGNIHLGDSGAAVDLTSLMAESISGSITATVGSKTGKVDIETVSGGVALSGSSQGEVKIQTTSGAVSVADFSAQGALEVQTISGNIGLSGSAQSLSLGSTSGDITATVGSKTGEMDIETLSGTVNLTGAGQGDVRIQTTSGAIRLMDFTPGGSVLDIETMSGSVEIGVAAGTQAFTFEFESLSGKVRNETQGGTQAERGGDIRVESTSGDLHLSDQAQ